MSPDLKYLLLSTILCFVQMLVAATGANQAVGLPTLAGNREGLPEITGWAGRAKRAHLNMIENLVLFAALVLIAVTAGKANAMTATEPRLQTPTVAPVGIGWRHPHHAELLQRQPALDFIEVHSENFFAPGGAARAVLRQGREHYPVSLHGVGLSLGSAGGVDPWHLDQLTRLVQTIVPVRVSDHASFARGPGAHANDLLPVPLTHAALDAMCANVNRVQDRLRRPIAVENLSAYFSFRTRAGDDALDDGLGVIDPRPGGGRQLKLRAMPGNGDHVLPTQGAACDNDFFSLGHH